ncbi:MAG: metallophosphoesterase [Gemmatimonadota bacterium]|nr:metallophosphoesterase [Gemmatimonadota bacterium]
MLSRRQLLAAGAGTVAGAVLGTAAYAFLIEPHWVELVRRPMPLEHLPDALVGRTLLQVSDIHVGVVDEDYLMRTLRSAAALAPDFVVVTGDFLSYRSDAQYDQLARVLRHLPAGRLGTVAALGNHDYGPGWRNLGIANRVQQIVSDAGAILLRNSVRTAGGIQFAGTADYWSPEFGSPRGNAPHGLFTPRPPVPDVSHSTPTEDARSAILQLVPGQPTIVLCHNPDALDEPMWTGVRGWVLAGHTHGGQVRPLFCRRWYCRCGTSATRPARSTSDPDARCTSTAAWDISPRYGSTCDRS